MLTFSLAEKLDTIDSSMWRELIEHIGTGVIGAYVILMVLLAFVLWSDYQGRKK